MERGFADSGEERQAWEETSRAEVRSHESSSRHRSTPDGYVVRTDLPETFPVTSEEIALLRAFLHDEIQAILNGEDDEG